MADLRRTRKQWFNYTASMFTLDEGALKAAKFQLGDDNHEPYLYGEAMFESSMVSPGAGTAVLRRFDDGREIVTVRIRLVLRSVWFLNAVTE